MRRTVCSPSWIVVIVTVPVAVRVVPLLRVHWEGITALIDVKLAALVDVVQVVVAIAVLIGIGPLFGVTRPDVCSVEDAPSSIRIRIAVAIGVQTAVTVHVGGPGGAHAGIGLCGRRGVVPVTVAVRIVPLAAVGGEGIDDAVALVRGIVAVVVLVDVGVPEVDALVPSAVGGHEMGAVWTPREAVDDAAIVRSTKACAATWSRPGEVVDHSTGRRLGDVGRHGVSAVPVHPRGNVSAVRAEFNGGAGGGGLVAPGHAPRRSRVFVHVQTGRTPFPTAAHGDVIAIGRPCNVVDGCRRAADAAHGLLRGDV